MSTPRKLRGLLIDLNGTLHVGSEPTPGAVLALERLRAAQIPFIFCSNSTKESSASLLGKLNDMGFKAEKEELITSLGACKRLVEKRGLNRPLLLMSPSAKEEFSSTRCPDDEGEDYDSVILGLHEPSLGYDSLNKAFRVLKGEPISHSSASPSAGPSKAIIPLIAPHAGTYIQSPASSSSSPSLPAGLSLGIGPFVRLLEGAAGVRAEIVGKPTKAFFSLAIERMRGLYPDVMADDQGGKDSDGSDSGEIGVVGDDVDNDLGGGARELGLNRFLVKTGKYRPGAEGKNASESPDGIYETFSDFVDDLIQRQ